MPLVGISHGGCVGFAEDRIGSEADSQDDLTPPSGARDRVAS